MQVAGRLVGLFSAAAAVGLWIAFLFFNPYGSAGITATTYVAAAAMSACALIAGFGAAYDKPNWLFATFAVSFVPVGFYTLGAEGPFRLIGVANLLYLLSGVLLRIAARQSRL